MQDIQTPAVTIHTRIGGSGPPVVLLHGYGETGDMWAPMAADLARDHQVIVPDLRGLGLSSKPPAVSTRRRRRGISWTCWRRLVSARSTSSHTTSETWWPSSSPHSIRTELDDWC
ncbi:alpha/beta fold hydrolase [Paeniroseomonas aquatica]|uniref:alpha/beta fold hydrolase n=1 Tax=Paeniroseomonas aquatica TaxID=373043 RepID=UPI003616DE85